MSEDINDASNAFFLEPMSDAISSPMDLVFGNPDPKQKIEQAGQHHQKSNDQTLGQVKQVAELLEEAPELAALV